MVECDTSLVVPAITTEPLYCVVEHQAVFEPGSPPEIVYVHFCKLNDVYRFNYARQNTEWQRLFGSGGEILVRILAYDTDIVAIRNHALEYIRSLPKKPVCNLHGLNTKGAGRSILCSNGKTYASQHDAAEDLGIPQSSISRHLSGHLQHVGGFTFCYTRQNGELIK